MQSALDDFKARCLNAYSMLFYGRISRTTFLVRSGVIAAAVWLAGTPLTTILSTSTKTIQDFYLVVGLIFFACCVLGFFSAYVKRLHDFGLAGFWSIIFVIAIPISIAIAGFSYSNYRYEQDSSASMSEFNNMVSWAMACIPIIIGLWKGDGEDNKFGPPPLPVEHLLGSKFSVFAVLAAIGMAIPTSIYVGLFQDGVWVGRGNRYEPLPMMQSNVEGLRFMRCWNVKGVGAGSGTGHGSGVYRDGYSGNVFDFLVTPTGQIDIAMAGERAGSSYLNDGFRIIPYGLDVDAIENSYINVRKLDKFMLVAIFDDGGKNASVNYTAFAFSRNQDGWPNYNVVMTSAISTSPNAIEFADIPAAKGRLMIGDCIPG
jgi:uncharacterized membrane protein YhaH (DUF805 family)